MMPRDRLVVREDLRLVPRPGFGCVRVDVVPSWPRAIRRGGAVIRDRRVFLLVRLNADDLALGFRQAPEEARNRAARAGQGLSGLLLDLVARAEVEVRIRAESLQDRDAISRAERLLPEVLEFAVDPPNLAHPGRVDIVRREVERGIRVDQSRIRSGSPRDLIQAGSVI